MPVKTESSSICGSASEQVVNRLLNPRPGVSIPLPLFHGLIPWWGVAEVKHYPVVKRLESRFEKANHGMTN
jgi:hypothetical protein